MGDTRGDIESNGAELTKRPQDSSEVNDENSIPASNGVGDSQVRTNDRVDIEHVPVKDDPRAWSKTRKLSILVTVSCASMIATLGANIYNPAISEVQRDLRATNAEIALSLSVFILVQGTAPLFWSAVSEIKGRKKVYVTSELVFVVGCIIVATAKDIAVVIVMRCVQAFGASAVLSIGAATLADIYEPHERGTMMGIYYAAPLLGPSMGPLVGGIATQIFNWRATFWFLVIFGGLSLLTFIVFKDTFRRERSLTYQSVLWRMRRQRIKTQAALRGQELEVVSASEKKTKEADSQEDSPGTPVSASNQNIQEIKLSLKDVNPFSPLIMVIRRMNNVIILSASGFLFAITYCIGYTCSRTLAMKYHYNALQIGLVLLSFGLGCMAGSILGGRWSDRVLRKLKEKNGGRSDPEMRLESTKLAWPFTPLTCIAYAWLCQERVHVAAVCTALFFAGFFIIWIYSSTLAYIVDANTGRSSIAVATNSCFRGTFGFIAAEVAAPLQDAIGDGGLYTIWAGLMVVTELLILLVIWKGGKWREAAIADEESRQ